MKPKNPYDCSTCDNEDCRKNYWEAGYKTGIKEMMELNDELLEIGRKAIEDALVDWRDNRLSVFNRGNGLVIKERNGEDSSIIRFGPEMALRIGLKAIGQAKLKE